MKELINISGIVYKDNYFTIEEFKKKYGIDPLRYPKYFRVSKRISCTKLFVDLCNDHYKKTNSNWFELGIQNK